MTKVNWLAIFVLLLAQLGTANAQEAGTVSADNKELAISGNKKKLEHTCDPKGQTTIVISGNGHTITLKGECEEIVVSGNAHEVTAEAAGRISVSGLSNRVLYQKGLGGKPPKVTTSGLKNSVEKIEPKP